MIDGLRLENPLVLAPMAGVTDLPFRRLARRDGCALAFTEMVKDCSLTRGNPRSNTILTLGEDDHPVGVQLLGSDPDLLAAAAQLAEARGADLIDLNLGCPAPKVMRNGEGAALLRDPGRITLLVESLVKAVAIPVTVKLRRGVRAGEETALEVARRAAEAGAAAVTVHGRFAAEFYSGKADWGVIARVCEAIEIPVIGNGDVTSGPEVRRLLETTGCQGVMIGRVALGRPWIFREILDYLEGRRPEPPSPEERLAMVLEQLYGLVALRGPRQGVFVMRKHAGWYVRGLPGAASLRTRLFQAATPGEMENLLRQALGGESSDLHSHRRQTDPS